MKLFKKSWKKYVLLITFSILAYWGFVSYTTFTMNYEYRKQQDNIQLIAQNKTGICIKEGRVLTKEEHRKAVLNSLAQQDITDIKYRRDYRFDSTSQAGIISNTESLDFIELLDKFFNNDKSFEENFKIKEFYPRALFDIKQLKEPFIFVNYDSADNSHPVFTASKDIVRLDEEESKEIRNKNPLEEKKLAQGFGNYYYKVTSISIDKRCCDNGTSSSNQDEIFREKTKGYLDSIKNNGKIGPKTHTQIETTSNCGEVLLPPYLDKDHKDYEKYKDPDYDPSDKK